MGERAVDGPAREGELAPALIAEEDCESRLRLGRCCDDGGRGGDDMAVFEVDGESGKVE